MKRFIPLLMLTASFLNAEVIEYSESVKVVSSNPYYRDITNRIPYEECWDERVPITTYRDKDAKNNSDLSVGAIIGGAAGGIIGHQIGKGHGKEAATIGGAVLGTLIGKGIIDNNSRVDDYQNEVRYENRKKCVTKYKESSNRVMDGYKNIAYYKGKKIVKYSNRALRYIPITIRVSY